MNVVGLEGHGGTCPESAFGGRGSRAEQPAPLISQRGFSPAASLLLFAIRLYQVTLAPYLGGACKFYPSCSRYAAEAVELYGARRGGWLALKRLLRCRPFSQGGFDSVPQSEEPAS